MLSRRVDQPPPVLRDTNPAGIGLLAAMQGVAPSLGIELTPVGVRDANEIERGIVTFADGLNGGLIVTLSGFTITHHDLISKLSIQHRLPAIYPGRYFVTGGGLIGYGPDEVDPFRRAAVHRILKGEKPATCRCRRRRPRFTISLKRSTTNLQLSTTTPADYPIFWG